MASESPVYGHARQRPLYPRYQVAGRDPADQSAGSHNHDDQDRYDDLPRWTGTPSDRLLSLQDRRRWTGHPHVRVETLRRSASFDASPTPTPPRLPTIDVTNDRISAVATRPPQAATNFRKMPLRRTVSEDLTEPAQIPVKKRPRYLRDVDRRSIIQRIDNGEKQAALAREYGVTRAAICHIKKNREEIVARYELLLASAKELILKERPPPAATTKGAVSVQELTQPSVQLLLTTLRDATTTHRTFRTSANRLMTVLIEEAMASATMVSCTLRTTNGQTLRGVKAAPRSVCCVRVGEKGRPLVEMHRHQNQQCLFGAIGFVGTKNGSVLDYVDLPPDFTRDAGVVLLSVSSATGESLCASVQALQQIGIALEDIQIAVLVCTLDAIDRVTAQFPGVRILTCAVETVAQSAAKATTLRDFLDRYDAIKPEPLVATSEETGAWETWDQAWRDSE